MSTPTVHSPTRVFVVDDHALFTTILADILNSSGEFTAAGVAGDAESALVALRTTPADILLVDLKLPGMSGIELVQAATNEGLKLKIVVCSGVESDQSVEMAFAAGAHSFVEKSARIEDLLATLRRVALGECPLTPRAARVLREAVRRRHGMKPLASVDVAILRQLAEQKSPKEIAGALGLSQSCIYKARKRITARTGASHPAELPAVAARLGLVEHGYLHRPEFSETPATSAVPADDPVGPDELEGTPEATPALPHP